jgi:hypothetical protein
MAHSRNASRRGADRPTKVAGVVVAIVFGLTVSVPSGASSASSDEGRWEDVASLPHLASLRVLDDSGRVLTGPMERATADELVLSDGVAMVSVRRDRIRRVEVRSGRATARGARRGFVLGLAVGAALGSLAETNKAAWISSLALGWGAVGAGTGAISGRETWRYVVVYRTRSTHCYIPATVSTKLP